MSTMFSRFFGFLQLSGILGCFFAGTVWAQTAPTIDSFVSSQSNDKQITFKYTKNSGAEHRIEARRGLYGDNWKVISVSFISPGTYTYTHSDRVFPAEYTCFRVLKVNTGEYSNIACRMADSDSSGNRVKPTLKVTDGITEKIPASFLFKRVYNGDPDSIRGMAFRTACENGGDTGILVEVEGNAYFNDDNDILDYASVGAPNIGYSNGLGSEVDIAFIEPNESQDVTVYVFSMVRSTSPCTLWYNHSNQGWTQELHESDPNAAGNPIHFGGTVIKVGPLNGGDFLEVFSSQEDGTVGGTGDEPDTHMVLAEFDLVNGNHGPFMTPVYSDDAGAYMDPYISIITENWNEDATEFSQNYVVLGKEARHATGSDGVEVRVDLGIGPFNADFTSVASTMSENGYIGNWHTFTKLGQYTAWLEIATSEPIGDPSKVENKSTDMPEDCENDSWAVRGRTNIKAFKIKSWYKLGSSQSEIVYETRNVMLGAFGADGSAEWHRFMMDIPVTADRKEWRITVEDITSTVPINILTVWSAHRNQTSSDFKVASNNTRYDYPDENIVYNIESEARNLAHLLAGRGIIVQNELSDRSGQVIEEYHRATQEYDADIILLQEAEAQALTGSNWDNWIYGVRFLEEIRGEMVREFNAGVNSLDWEPIFGTAEQHGNWPVHYVKGTAPIFLNEHVKPAGFEEYWFPVAALNFSGCDQVPGEPNNLPSNGFSRKHFAGCHIEDAGLTEHYAVPGKAALMSRVQDKYNRISNVPVAVFNVHLPHGDQFTDRRAAIDNLIDHVGELLEHDPEAFNGTTTCTSKTCSRNRFIIAGDWNIASHSCGEHYWLTKRLRDNFGYALDVASAFYNKQTDNHMATHDIRGELDFDNVPLNYESFTDWQAVAQVNLDAAYSTTRDYPWWAATFRGESEDWDYKTNRYDVFMLVGKGWMDDDPVRDYKITKVQGRKAPGDVEDANYVNSWSGLGSAPDYCEKYSPPLFDRVAYEPYYHISYCGKAPGDPIGAMDHNPLMTQLRVLSH